MHWRPWALVVFSYLPLIALQRGGINADTKLYLGQDPAGLIARSLFAWDSSQFGGFVPHQAIAYLWPSGPFYWFFDLIGSPQWFTQRIWVGSIFMAAALGAYIFLRHLAFSANASVVGALFFMSSPYVLAYQSRTSSMLLAWAGVTWLSYFTARAMTSRSWLWPSLIALTMFTIGSVNATATLLILPAPFIVAVLSYRGGNSFKTLLAFSIKTFVLTTGVSVWWIAMLNIQATYGAKLLSYSETLESVASTPHAFEVLRGFGYWLNYVGLDTLPLTSGALRVFTSTPAMVAGVLLVTIAVGALALSRNVNRRIGLWLVLGGVVLSVGVYPLGD
jgi:arabinofuranan 3-O-arabinosyltransferase